MEISNHEFAEECGDGLMEENNKTVEDVLDERTSKMFQGFAMMMDAFWGNNNGTNGLEKLLKQNSSVLEESEDGDK